MLALDSGAVFCPESWLYSIVLHSILLRERRFHVLQFDRPSRRQSSEFSVSAARDEWGRGGRADPTRRTDWDERVYRFGIPEGGADGAGAAHHGRAPAGTEVQSECVYRGVDRAGAR